MKSSTNQLVYGIGMTIRGHIERETTEKRQPKRKSFIGKRMVVQDNSYITTQGNVECCGLYGKVVEIISEPYNAVVENPHCNLNIHPFVNVRSIETGIEYRTLFYEDWICENNDVQKYGVRGRYIRLSDGSYSKEINGEGHIYGCENAPMRILTEPYKERIEVFPNEYKYYLCVTAKDLRSGKDYRILFNEEDLLEENPYAEVIINVSIKIID